MNKTTLSDEQIKKLKAPLPPEAIKPHPTKSYLSTIKAIYVIERFNEVFGLGGWFINNEVVEIHEKNIVVKSTFHADAFGIVIPDIFGGNDNTDRGDAYKGACTDALTKIGSYLYVGMDVFKGLGDGQKVAQKPESPKVERMPAGFFDDTEKRNKALSAIAKAKDGKTLDAILSQAKVYFDTGDITEETLTEISKAIDKKRKDLP